MVGRFARLVPRRLLSACENRWAGQARLSCNGTESTGSVVHEVVAWT
jgi:hypothetical protein